MVHEELYCGSDGSRNDPFVSCRNDEQNALAAFCTLIGSSSSCSDALPGIADETRREAKLLMSLILTNDASLSDDEESSDFCDPPTFSSSNTSLTSDSAALFAGRDEFYFACPSLSLENPTSLLQCETSEFHASSDPALLLNRTLKVDDRDALRLSADAMARNVLQSMQTAMEWRIQAWVYVLSKRLVAQECSLMESGASEEDLKELLDTPEASLVMALRSIAEGHRISVKSVTTRFDVLPQRIPTLTTDGETNVDAFAVNVKRCSLGSSDLDDNASSTSSSYQSVESNHRSYSYDVIHQLRLSCDIHLETPAGFGEINIDVPGTIEGSFLSNECDTSSTLKAVTMNLDTNVMASMVEKASRTIVRTSTETALTHCDGPDLAEETDLAAATDICSLKQPHTLMSPPTSHPNDVVYVTPRMSHMPDDDDDSPSVAPALPSIPDDFDSSASHSSRVSPQPSQLDFDASNCIPSFAPRSELKRGLSTTTDDCTADVTASKKRLPLISPLAGQDDFHEVPENGPSLPMLVEVACRALHVS